MRIPAAVLVAAFAQILMFQAFAQDATVSLPKPRPPSTGTIDAPPAAGTPDVPLPRTRPDADKADKADSPAAKPDTSASEDAIPEAAGPDGHVVPEDEPQEAPKPARVYQSACPAVVAGQVEADTLPPIAENQCGARSPLALTGVLVNGRMVPVSGGVTTSCGVATALPAWAASIDAYLFAKENTRLDEVLVGTSYMCRNVNNAGSGNLSFHAFAEALDVIGFKLQDGRTVTVEGGWSDALSSEGRLLRFAHDSACTQFTTTLGPEANALHHDHLHVDMGCHGKTCTARLCE